MNPFLLLIFVGLAFTISAQNVDTLKQKDTVVSSVVEERRYKVDMMGKQKDTIVKGLNFQQPYYDKRLESNYEYNDGKVTGGATKLKLGKKKNH